jgi:ubiquinone/menaquinone biosynthesis C-methylase UbiE
MLLLSKAIMVLLLSIIFGILSLIDLRLISDHYDDDLSPSDKSVIKFYDIFGGILMNNLYHRLFEEESMNLLVNECDFNNNTNQNILEIGPGTGYLANKILNNIDNLNKNTKYIGIDLSKTMINKAKHNLKEYINQDIVSLHFVNNSILFTDESLFNNTIDRVVLTYVLDLMSASDIHILLNILKYKMKNNSKICLINLTYGNNSISRIITNIWQIIYKLFGKHSTGGCRPLNMMDYFINKHNDLNMSYEKIQISTGLPSQIIILSK